MIYYYSEVIEVTDNGLSEKTIGVMNGSILNVELETDDLEEEFKDDNDYNGTDDDSL